MDTRQIPIGAHGRRKNRYPVAAGIMKQDSSAVCRILPYGPSLIRRGEMNTRQIPTGTHGWRRNRCPGAAGIMKQHSSAGCIILAYGPPII